MTIREVKRYSKKVHKAVARLLPQLDPDIEAITKKRLKAIIKSGNSHFFIAESEEGDIAGMLTVVVYLIPAGIKLWVEDVVVDHSFRGKGIGRKLMLHAMKFAEIIGAGSVDLTSRPSREAANNLYNDMGFELRETNVYRYNLKN